MQNFQQDEHSMTERAMRMIMPRQPIQPSQITSVGDVSQFVIENMWLVNIYDRIFYYNGKCYVQAGKAVLKGLTQKGIDMLLSTPEFTFRAFTLTQVINHINFLLLTKQMAVWQPCEEYGLISFLNGSIFTEIEQTYLGNIPTPAGTVPTYYINTDVPMYPLAHPMKIAMPYMRRFLDTITNKDQTLINRIWEMIGYLLYENVAAKKVFVLQGKTNSGKSVLGKLITSLLSDGCVRYLDIEQLNQRNATSELVGMRLNVSMDLPNRVLPARAVENIKLLTGNDDIEVFNRNGTFQRYNGHCKFLFATNHCITLCGSDPGFLSRVICIPFDYEIEMEKQDLQLFSRLWAERDAIAKVALYYHKLLKNKSFVFSGSNVSKYDLQVRYIYPEAENREETVRQFVEEKCIISDKRAGKTYTKVLYSAYLDYCEENKFTPIDTIAGFSRTLSKAYAGEVEQSRWREGEENQHGFKGIQLRIML